MPIAAKRVFRLSLTIALCLAVAYGLDLPLPYMGPLLAIFLTAAPRPPMGFKALLGLLLVVSILTGSGLLMIPLLTHYAAPALIIITLGIYLANVISLNLGKPPIGAFLTVGLTLISAIGTANFQAGTIVLKAILMGMALAILCQWIVYPFFPEAETIQAKKTKDADRPSSRWLAWRATLIVMPAYLMALTNPAMYMPIVMKSVSLGQQSEVLSARNAGKELLGSTFFGGCFAVLFWVALSIEVNLWMFALWMALSGLFFASKLYAVLPSNYPGSFWVNTFVTMIILIGPAVEDTENGKDVYKAFAVRIGLFVAVTLYAWIAIVFLEWLRDRAEHKRQAATA